jgi:ppGpp synthetase/RelA/SpoT-type nucleotidyltranferase
VNAGFSRGSAIGSAKMSNSRKAEKFLENYGGDYLDLLRKVREACEEVGKHAGPGVVDNIYGRRESVGGDKESDKFLEFKEPAKIATKARQKNKPFLELTDIVGLTVVMQYPDQVDDFIQQAIRLLAEEKIKVLERENHVAKNGYYATHVIVTRRYGVDWLHCEMQIKTILHDAWSAKMHDLTYKPMGMLDARLQALMASIAGTIDSLEFQSRLIRDMIKSGWNVEEKTRRIARKNIYEELLKYWNLTQNIIDLQVRIENAAGLLEKESINHPDVVALLEAVNEICKDRDTLRYGWMLAGRVASLQPSPEFTRFFIKHADAWLELAPQLLAMGKIHEKEISAVPLMFYVIGDLERAIDYTTDIFEGATFARLTAGRKARLDFNRATFMIEREYHFPTTDPPSRRQLKREILKMLSAPALVKLRRKGESEFRDTEGLLKIAFADNKDDARSGIEDCVAARSTASAAVRTLIDSYADLNMRLGWRRYFELELREGVQLDSTKSPPPNVTGGAVKKAVSPVLRKNRPGKNRARKNRPSG